MCPFPEAESATSGTVVAYVPDPQKSWFVFRASYGREDRAFDYLVNDGTYSYIAKRYVEKYVHGKRKRVFETLIPNLLFVYTTPEQAETYIKATPELSFLTYYYNHFQVDETQKNPPLVIPNREMDNFIRATWSHNEHLLFVNPEQCHYKSGDTVRIVDGLFSGVEGRVARVSGQQRVVVTLSKIGLISTAYIPTAFLERVNSDY